MLSSILKVASNTIRIRFYKSYDLILYVMNFLVEVIVYIAVWQGIYENGSQMEGMNIHQMTTYYILVVSLAAITYWGMNEEIGISITKGEIHRDLLNPLSYFQYNFGKKIGDFVQAVVVGLATFFICHFIWGALMPASIIHLIIFGIMILFSTIILYFFEMIIGMCAFYTNMLWGMEILKRSILMILSGAIAPITLFPQWLQTINQFLPFQEVMYVPINVYLGLQDMTQIPFIIGKQIIWIILLYLLAKVFFNKAIKHITINGG